MSFLRKRIDRVRYLWRAALAENQDPKKFAFAVAVGAFMGTLPVPPVGGLRSFAGIGAGWLMRCSKLTTFLGSHVPLYVLLSLPQVRLGALILRRPVPPWGDTWSSRLDAAQHALLAWWIGAVLIAPLVAALAYAIALPLARRYRARLGQPSVANDH